MHFTDRNEEKLFSLFYPESKLRVPVYAVKTGLVPSVGPGRDRGAWGMNAATRDLCVWLRIEFHSHGKTAAHFPSYGSVRRSKTAMPSRPGYSYFDTHYHPLLAYIHTSCKSDHLGVYHAIMYTSTSVLTSQPTDNTPSGKFA